MNTKIYKDENEFLKCLDIAVRAFKVYSETEKKDEKTLTFSNALLEGEIEYHLEQDKTLDYTKLYYRVKKEHSKDFSYQMRKYVKVLYCALYRSTLATFARENKELINFDEVKNSPKYSVIMNKILSTDSSLSEAQKLAILSCDAEIFLTNICNQIAHGNVHNLMTDEEGKKARYIEIMGKYRMSFKDYDIKRAVIKDKAVERTFFQDEIIRINFFSYRLNKNCQFDLREEDVFELLILLASNIQSREIQFELKERIEEVQRDYRTGILNTEYFTLSEENRPYIQRLLNQYSVTKDANLVTQAKALMKEYPFTDVQKEFAITKTENFIQYFKDEYGNFNDFLTYAIAKCSIDSCVFAQEKLIGWYREQVLYTTFLRLVYFNLPFMGEGDKNTIDHILLVNMKNCQEVAKNDSHDFITTIYFSEKKNLYNQMLLTETLNILQLAEKKGLWNEIAENSLIVKRIAEECELEDKDEKTKELYVLEKLRNSFQHIRYIKDQESFLIFDGKDKEHLQFQFEIFTDELEEFKNSALQTLTNYNLKEIANLESLKDTVETEVETEDL